MSLPPPPPPHAVPAEARQRDWKGVGVVVVLLRPLLGHDVAVPAVVCHAPVGVVCTGMHDVA
jgi:hypothetical protein